MPAPSAQQNRDFPWSAERDVPANPAGLGRRSRVDAVRRMVSVGRVGGPAVPGGASRRVGGSSGFAVAPGGADATAGPSATTAAAPLDGMLLLQQVEDGPTRDRQARRHGRAMLDGLAELQCALLDGTLDPRTVERLAALAQHCPEASEPGLRAALAGISLRVQVELARRTA